MATVDVVTKLWNNLYVGLDKVIRSFQENEVPTAPVMLATATGQTTISLSIVTPSAVVGHAPVHGYKFYTDALVPVSSNVVDVIGVGTGVGYVYNVTGLTASTSYSYVAKGLSVDNVLSGSSAVVSATTQSVSAPVHSLTPLPIPNQTINPGQSFTPFNLNLFFSDTLAHSLAFSVSGTRPPTMQVNLSTGDVTFSGPESSLASYSFSFTADDGYTGTLPLPLQVTGLTAPVQQAAYVTLTWNNLDNESGYYVERSLNNSTWSTVGSTLTDVVTYTDSTVSATTLYYYRVRAFNSTGNGAYSATINLTTPVSSVGPAELDWLDRSTAGGVIQATDFRDADVALFTMGIATIPANVSRYSGDSVSGGKCLRIDIPAASGTDPGSWKCFLNRAWNGMSIGTPQPSVGMGSTEFYVQYRMKFPATWLPRAPGADNQGKKCSIVSTNYHSNVHFEHVIQDLYARNVVQAYRQTDGIPDVYKSNNYQFEPFTESHAPADYKLQNSIAAPYCLQYAGGSSYNNCYMFTPEVWHCFLQRIKVVTYGGTTGNEYDLWAWKPGDSGYTQLMAFRNYAVGNKYDSNNSTLYSNGFNGVFLTPYTSQRYSSTYTIDSYVLYDQLIVSTSAIACPTV